MDNLLDKDSLMRIIDGLCARRDYEEEIGEDLVLADALTDAIDGLLNLFSVLFPLGGE